MIKLEFPRINLSSYPTTEEKVGALKSQIDTLMDELYITLDSIESGADSLLERQTNSDGTVSFYPMDINADKTAVSFFEKAPTDDEGVFAPPMDTTELNDFIDSLNRDFRGSVDWIVEEGTSGIWTYEKWNSGIAKCWGTVFGNTTNGASVIDFPSGLFYNNDNQYFNVQATLYYGEGDNPNRGARPLMLTEGSTSTQCVIYMRTTSNTAYSGYYGLRLSAKGRWK